MHTYTYTVVAIPMTGVASQERILTGTITCNSFLEAARMATDSEGDSWELKRSFKELVSLVKVR